MKTRYWLIAALLAACCTAQAQDPLSADDAKPGRDALCRQYPERCQTVEEAKRECSYGGKNCAALTQQTQSDRQLLEQACDTSTAACEKKRAQMRKREQKCEANPAACR